MDKDDCKSGLMENNEKKLKNFGGFGKAKFRPIRSNTNGNWQ